MRRTMAERNLRRNLIDVFQLGDCLKTLRRRHRGLVNAMNTGGAVMLTAVRALAGFPGPDGAHSKEQASCAMGLACGYKITYNREDRHVEFPLRAKIWKKLPKLRL